MKKINYSTKEYPFDIIIKKILRVQQELALILE